MMRVPPVPKPRSSASPVRSAHPRASAPKPVRLPRKLTVGAAGHPLEREADRVADQVLAERAPRDATPDPVTVHRHGGGDDGGAAAPASVHRVLAQPGRPLDLPVRREMEAGFGRDFSEVRFHDGADAARSAREVSAAAYAVGRHIVFGAGRFAPEAPAGKRLVAHELAHVVQQDGMAGALRRAPEQEPAQEASLPPDESLATRLAALIAQADWEVMRPELYEKESAVDRARVKKGGPAWNQSGLGATTALAAFAADVRQLQGEWANLSVEDRLTKIKKTINARLAAADVFGFEDVKKNSDLTEQSHFNTLDWTLELRENLLTSDIADVDAAASLANALYHEARHAEQTFLLVRQSVNGMSDKERADTAQFAKDQLISDGAAKDAVSKFGKKLSDETEDFIDQMNLWRWHKGDKRTEELRKKIDTMQTERNAASAARKDLELGETPSTRKAASEALVKLKAAVEDVEDQYKLYRRLDDEVDAQRVADAAEKAFRAKH